MTILIDDGEGDEPAISKPWVGRHKGGKAASEEERCQNTTFKWSLALVSKEFKVSCFALLASDWV